MAENQSKLRRLTGRALLALVPLALAGAIASFITSKDLKDQALDPLGVIRQLTKSRLKNYFGRIEALTAATAARPAVVGLAAALKKDRGAGMRSAARLLGPMLKQIVPGHEGYEVVFFGPGGAVLYTTGKPKRQARLAKLVRVKGGVLALAFNRAQKAAAGRAVIQDFGLLPGELGPAAQAVVAAPVRRSNHLVGVLAVLIPAEALGPVVGFPLGRVRVYAVGPDRVVRPWLRMPSHLDDSIWKRKRELIQERKIAKTALYQTITLAAPGQAGTVKTPRIASKAVAEALGGKTGRRLTAMGPGGVRVVSAYGPLEVAGLPWAIIAEVDYDQAMIPVARLRRVFINLGVFIIVIYLLGLLLSLASNRLPILAEFWEFLRYRKKYWLLPIVLVLLFIGLLLVLAGGAGPVTPFIYALF
ncbi:MAG: hypothetical protein KJ621_09815 [Proteobacteria bacterium]|nr:hypothetical protein [Pseudomonadota bacterium]